MSQNLTSKFIIYISAILLLVVGATNYLLYRSSTDQLHTSFDLLAQSHLQRIKTLSGYYISHFEMELLSNLVHDSITDQSIILLTVKSLNGDFDYTAGAHNVGKSKAFYDDIFYNERLVGKIELAIDTTQLNRRLIHTQVNSLTLAFSSILLIGGLVYLFFRGMVMADVRRAHAEKDLAQEEMEFFSAVMDKANSLVIVLDSDARVVMANKRCDDKSTNTSAIVPGTPFWDYFPVQHEGHPLKEYFDAGSPDDPKENMQRLKSKTWLSIDGEGHEKRVIEWILKTLHKGENQTPYLIATGTDVTLRHREKKQLEFLAHHDPLTGLPNRPLFMDRLDLALTRHQRTGEPFYIFYLDLDRFKPINDNFGHEAGDMALKHVAELLLQNTRKLDTAARLGGDEFGIILNDCKNEEDATMIASKLIDQIAQPLTYLTHQLKIGASIGIASYSEHCASSEKLLKQADEAMYRAKQAGRNQYCFSDV